MVGGLNKDSKFLNVITGLPGGHESDLIAMDENSNASVKSSDWDFS